MNFRTFLKKYRQDIDQSMPCLTLLLLYSTGERVRIELINHDEVICMQTLAIQQNLTLFSQVLWLWVAIKPLSKMNYPSGNPLYCDLHVPCQLQRILKRQCVLQKALSFVYKRTTQHNIATLCKSSALMTLGSFNIECPLNILSQLRVGGGVILHARIFLGH